LIVFYHRDTAFIERAAIREHDGGMTRAEAERATAAHEGLICSECKARTVIPEGQTKCEWCLYVIVRGAA